MWLINMFKDLKEDNFFKRFMIPMWIMIILSVLILFMINKLFDMIT